MTAEWLGIVLMVLGIVLMVLGAGLMIIAVLVWARRGSQQTRAAHGRRELLNS